MKNLPTTCFLLAALASSLLVIPAATADVDYLSEVTSATDLASISVPFGLRPEIVRVSKFTTPASDDPLLLETVYQNVKKHTLHFDFLVEVFPDYFSWDDDYDALFLERATRQYYVGGLYQLQDPGLGTIYGFEIATDPADATEMPTAAETEYVYNQLVETFHPQPFYYAPSTAAAVDVALSWESPSFPIYYFPGDIPEPAYEPYTIAVNYGRVRLMTLSQLAEETSNGRVSWQDIVVLDKTPFDIEGVVAGVITGERQGELSHVAVRSARRGTPNAHVKNAHEAFAPYVGQLVKLDIGDATYTVETGVDPAVASAYWAENRPALTDVASADLYHASLENLLEMDVEETTGSLTSKYGGKASNTAKMFAFLPAENQVPGFAIPFHYYHEFMVSNQIPDDRSQPAVLRTFDEYIRSLIEDPQFQTDGGYRATKLAAFRDYARDNGSVNPSLVSNSVTRIEEVFGAITVMVRFRSSSNVEDSLIFNGAGLYDSTSVCAQDSLDGDSSGPSHCDPTQTSERSIERGLKKVWASLWNYRAYEEREYYQIPQDRAAMAILVTPAVPDEASNGVAFTGDPIAGASAGYVINVQIGDNSVVHPDVDVLPERDVLRMEDGQVASINRARGSSLMNPGEWVLSDEQLGKLGAAMAIVDASFPLELDGYSRDDVLLDIEFKFTQEDNLIFKQVRPFLRTGVEPPPEKSPYDLDKDGSLESDDLFFFIQEWQR